VLERETQSLEYRKEQLENKVAWLEKRVKEKEEFKKTIHAEIKSGVEPELNKLKAKADTIFEEAKRATELRDKIVAEIKEIVEVLSKLLEASEKLEGEIEEEKKVKEKLEKETEEPKMELFKPRTISLLEAIKIWGSQTEKTGEN